MIVMIRYILVIDLRAVLRTMLIAGTLADAAGASRGCGMTRLLLVAAALAAVMAAVLAAAGVVSGAEWDVYPGGSIQDAVDGAGEGDTIYVHAGTNARECGCGQAGHAGRRGRGCGDGAGGGYENVYPLQIKW